jgi:2-polyprenyl-6-hydroxyphenyl methylase/3-demethylubiquinone-9 3-methyltransferase
VIVGAEYILGLLPRGTHRWEKLVRPDELEAALEKNGLNVVDERGVTLNIVSGEMQLSDDLDANYMVVAERPA